MPELTLPDATLHYEVSGSGPPLLLIAGFMSDGASWAPLLGLLEPHFTVIRPDNRSCGRTVPWNAPAGMEIWTDDLIALIDHLGHNRVHVAGHSLGGIIGWVLAAKAPQRVATLLMMGSAPILTPRNDVLFRALIAIRRSDAPPETWLHMLFPWLFRPEVFSAPDIVAQAVADSLAYPYAQSADAMEWQLDALQGTDPSWFAAPPPVPCKALLSPDDMLVPHADARASLGGIPTEDLPGLGHSLHWDDPQRIAQEVLSLTSQNSL